MSRAILASVLLAVVGVLIGLGVIGTFRLG
jgi:hypothetical protein